MNSASLFKNKKSQKITMDRAIEDKVSTNVCNCSLGVIENSF